MKAIVVHPGPHWAVADVYRGWIRGLIANGVDVRPFNFNDRLHAFQSAHFEHDGEYHRLWEDIDALRCASNGLWEACYTFQPDLVIVVSARLIPAYIYDQIRKRGESKVIVLHTECPYEDQEQLLVAPHVDLNVLNDPLNIDVWNDVAESIYMPHSYDPAVHKPGPSRYDLDFAWVGTAGATFPSRTRFFEQVAWRDADVLLAGLWDGVPDTSPLTPFIRPQACMDNDETAEVYRGARISANLYRTNDDRADEAFEGGWAMGPREVELAATGCFYARHSPTNHGGEGDEILPMLPTFTDPAELTEIIHHYLERPERRQELADQARAAVAERTFEHHAAELLRKVS